MLVVEIERDVVVLCDEQKFHNILNLVFMLALFLGVVYLVCASYIEFGIKGLLAMVCLFASLCFETYGYYNIIEIRRMK